MSADYTTGPWRIFFCVSFFFFFFHVQKKFLFGGFVWPLEIRWTFSGCGRAHALRYKGISTRSRHATAMEESERSESSDRQIAISGYHTIQNSLLEVLILAVILILMVTVLLGLLIRARSGASSAPPAWSDDDSAFVE